MKPKYYIYPNKKPDYSKEVIILSPLDNTEREDRFQVADIWYGEFLWRYAWIV